MMLEARNWENLVNGVVLKMSKNGRFESGG